ncbi:MAG: small subunit ribosomal protein [Actinomycetota bacterium]|jgi:small subunit ribosomal protein S1|nr:small subunit ribosomal protein [Actinomycetota bacterium]
MASPQDETAQVSASQGSEETLPDGHGGTITRTAPSTSGTTYAGGTIVENDVGETMEELMAAIDATIKPFSEGDLVKGTIVKIEKDEVLLDIGYKSEGVIPSRELSIRNDVDPSQIVSLGDELEALVLQKEDKEGRLILSKKRAQYEKAWGKIEEIKNADGIVEGPVIEVVKGGLILDIGLRGFLPASLVEMRRVRDLQPYVGKVLECRIIELDKNRNNVVLSRRKFLEESQAEQRQDFLTSLAKGEVREGVISSIVNFGAFVDLGGVDGLVHVSELSWKHVDHPSEVVEVGQEVKVEVLDVDLERERVSLSLKATQEDPWRQFAREHEVGDIIEGRVTKLVPFGAFVEVDDAIEGLVHISELAAHHVERPEDEVNVHDRVDVKIIDIDLDRRRISLSRKQTMPEAAGAIPEEEGGGTPAASARSTDIELEPEAAEMELEARESSENVGVATEDTIVRPETERELASAVEGAPELLDEPIAPEAASTVEEAVAAAPEEEKEQAELTAVMSPDSPPEAQAGILPDEPQERDLDKKLNQEEPDEGAAPGEAIAELDAEEVPVAEASDPAGETLDPGDSTGEESIESIVQDLKRERGQD